ncbi:uncharacterized protein LOC114177551 [Vigna unguiculata]|uniref:Uncharacterized protein family UPF0114 n=1 Tax=Vigna unguiculata TaxID=3917 RepID=A0A4D6L275_VIGUN|nr:uncharacterized protein LOC114177551 [Vigna unguiculata]QCD82589.1 Uncharacterized protein family UPF0114 [Vigna unguiculata]
MATTRILLRNSRPIQLPPSSHSSSSSSSFYMKCVRLHSRASFNGDLNMASAKGETKPVVAMRATMATTEHTTTSQPMLQQRLSDFAAFFASILTAILVLFWSIVKRKKPSNLQPQMQIEKAIIDCRFFTLFAVAGSLIGSVLCFVEGCLLVMESFAHYFHMLSQGLDQTHMMHLLIEAIDSFLVGTALLIFGMGMYVMFVRSNTTSKETEADSRFLMKFEAAPGWLGMQSIAEAKLKIGHAVMMILQVGVLEKLKDIPLVTGLDLACFAASVLTSSACIFVLSRLHHQY